jgi:hypothetical protein
MASQVTSSRTKYSIRLMHRRLNSKSQVRLLDIHRISGKPSRLTSTLRLLRPANKTVLMETLVKLDNRCSISLRPRMVDSMPNMDTMIAEM